MRRRLFKWIDARSGTAVLMLLAVTSAGQRAQASCGDYLRDAHFESPGLTDFHPDPVPHSPRHEPGCRNGSCRPSLPAPISRTSVWELVKQPACGTVDVTPAASLRGPRSWADDRLPAGHDPGRLFRPPRAA